MADHSSSKKAIRHIAKRTAINKSRINRIRTFIKQLEELITKSDKKAALAKFRETQSEVMRGVTKGVIKKNTASRKVSQLSAKVKAL
jgi:small subunit ribosomal protein S20